MKKVLFFMTISASFLFSDINLQTASKNELMCIKGIGAKKADAIIKYRKANKLTSANDLLKIKGFGKGLIEKVKKGEKTAKCAKKDAKKANNNAKTNEPKATNPQGNKK